MFLPFLFSMYIYNCIYLFWNYFVVWSICFLIFLSQCFLPVDLFFDSFSKNTWNLAIQSKIATLKPTNRLFCDAIVTDVAFFWPVTFQIVNGLWHHLPEAVAIVASATGRSNSTRVVFGSFVLICLGKKFTNLSTSPRSGFVLPGPEHDAAYSDVMAINSRQWRVAPPYSTPPPHSSMCIKGRNMT